jgi:hypothetical protein
MTTDIVMRLRQHQDAWKVRGDLPVPSSWHSLPDALGEAADEIERLRSRLEMTDAWQMIDGKMRRVPVELGSIPDGIDCRNETIRQQDELIANLRRRVV